MSTPVTITVADLLDQEKEYLRIECSRCSFKALYSVAALGWKWGQNYQLTALLDAATMVCAQRKKPRAGVACGALFAAI